MLSRSVFAVLLVVLAAVPAFGQRAYYVRVELNAPPVRAAGMGEVGVAVPDMDFVSINPAVAALATDVSLVHFSFYPGNRSSGWWQSVSVNHFVLSSHPVHMCDIGGVKLFLGGAYSRTGYKWPVTYTTIGRPDTRQNEDQVIAGTYPRLPSSAAEHNFTFAVGVDWIGSVSIGGTLKLLDYDVSGIHSGQDFGLMARLPEVRLPQREGSSLAWALTPSLGIAWTNLGEIGDDVLF